MEKKRFKSEFALWFCGFFDGEGCIYFNPSRVKKTVKGKKYSYPELQVCIGQSGEGGRNILEKIQKFFNLGRVSTHKKYGFNKLQPYQWRVHGKEALQFLKEIEPNLFLKKEKANSVIFALGGHYGEK